MGKHIWMGFCYTWVDDEEEVEEEDKDTEEG